MGFGKELLSTSGKRLIAYFRNKKNIFKEFGLGAFCIFIMLRARADLDTNLKNVFNNIAISLSMLHQFLIRSIIDDICIEKRENYREYMLINGLSKGTYYGQHLVLAYKSALMSSIFGSLGYNLSYIDYLPIQTFPLVFLTYICSGVAVAHFALLLTSILPPRSAVDIGGFGNLISGLLFFFAWKIGSAPVYYLLSFLPVPSTVIGILPLFPGSGLDGVVDTRIVIIISIISAVIYLKLFLHLEKDQERKPQRKLSDVSLQEGSFGSLAEHSLSFDRSESFTSSALHDEKKYNSSNVVVRIQDLHKKYGENHVIRGLSMQVTEGEIFCLLGHNGAGKSTVVNMLTGLVEPTSGKIYYEEKELYANFDKLRGKVGFCPQKDILDNDNTIEENLRIIAEIKNMDPALIDSEIEKVIQKCDLDRFRGKLAGQLSGGNKRKLCLGRAIIGGSKIIILDEPTSGMDPVSRRHIWEIIKQLKSEGKTLILTTQFLDEAEELSDRVAVLMKGNIFAVGSVDYINKNFGVGYHLILSSKNNKPFTLQEIQHFTNIVKRHIPSAERIEQSSEENIEYLLSFEEQGKFSSMFQELENHPEIKIGLQTGTLEEAFVNIGLNQDSDALESEDNNRVVINVESISPPTCYYKERRYSFFSQYVAMILRRYYNFIQDPASLVFAFLPTLLVSGVFFGTMGEDTDGKLMANLITVLGLSSVAFNTAAIVGHLVYEREHQITATLKVMGMRPAPYWLATFTVDMMIGLVISFFMFLPLFLSPNPIFAQMGYFSLFMIFAAFLFCVITEGYLYGMFITKSSLANKSFPFFILMGYIIPGVFFALSAENDVAKFIINSISFIIGPTFCFFVGIYAYFPESYRTPILAQALPERINCWFYILFMIVFGTICLILAMFLENKKYNLKSTLIQATGSRNPSVPIDEEVTKEKERLRNKQNNDLIKVMDLQKVYPNGYQALHDVSFGVEEGQIFGLLGPNGAGKSTTFNILSAVIPRSSGSVKLLNREIDQGIYEVFDQVGVCPQINPLWNELTTVDHLKVIAQMKGVDTEDIPTLIDYFLNALELKKFAKTKAGGLSGGNKRKLCVAMCLIGAPKIQFLDEPSTGVDPIARKYLWNCLKESMKGRKGSMILTTHYMQEAESISNKLGIIINGTMSCVGTLPDLKRRFGEYTIQIKTNQSGNTNELSSEIEQTLKGILPEVRNVSSTDEGILYKV